MGKRVIGRVQKIEGIHHQRALSEDYRPQKW